MDMDMYIGRLLDNRYEILEVIGTGGMAVVYKARCHRLNRLVAIKILKTEHFQDEEFRRRFHAESQAVAMLSHPNIVSVYDVSTSSDADYIVMELIDGISLKQYMEKKGVLNWKETLHFAIQIGKALEHAHSRGIVHRDIKPHNVMVLKNGSVKVADFGIARVMSKSNTLTKEALGSVHYISPEQAKGGRVDNRSDLYSLGVVMYEMMTGRPPYDGESPVAVAIQHINGGAKMPSTINPNIPGGLEQIIMKAMAHEPNDRYDNATAMLYDMDEFRKDPIMLFDYHTPPIDDVTRIHRAPLVPETVTPLPKTTAERVASGDQPRRRTPTSTTGRSRPAANTATGKTGTGAVSRNTSRDAGVSTESRRNQTARRRREEQTNRAAIIAIVVCSLVAIIAIGVFLWSLFGGGMINNDTPELLSVPNLLDRVYKDLPANYGGFEILVSGYEYSDTFEEGRIMDQNPPADEQVEKGKPIYVTISRGQEVTAKVSLMENLVGMSQQNAEKFLDGLTDMDLNVAIREEPSDEQAEGYVIRTQPAADETLTVGQTVTLWISTGPSEVKAKVPNVEGYNVATAQKILNQSGFYNIVTEPVDSTAAKEEVVGQSVEKHTEVDVNTEIILYVSKGAVMKRMPNVVGMNVDTAKTALNSEGFFNIHPEEVENDAPAGQVVDQSVVPNTEMDVAEQIVLYVSKGPTEPTTQPTEATQADVTKTVTITLVEEMTEDYKLTIMLDDSVLQELTVKAGESSVQVTLTGTGTVYYDLYINDVYFRTEKVEF